MLSYFIEHNRYMAFVGMAAIVTIAFLFSTNKKQINWRTIVVAFALQVLMAFFMLKISFGQYLIGGLAYGVDRLYQAAEVGSRFVFGSLIDPTGPWGFIFAFKVLPVIIFFGGFLALLFHYGIVQFVVNNISRVLRPILGTSGAETLCAIANSFLGQTEAPLLIRNYLGNMTRSEIFVVMVSGMATISGSILAVFSGSLGVPAEHLLAASMMSIPGALLIAKLMIPETEQTQELNLAEGVEEGNVFDALAVGTYNGLYLALNVAAALIVFVALMGLFNSILGWGCWKLNEFFDLGLPILSLQYLLGLAAAPAAYALGFTGDIALQVGSLLGTKVVVNEFVAFDTMMYHMALPARTVAITTYALCGFSNFSCIGIQVGGIGALCPSRRIWLTQLGLKAVLASSLVNLMNACLAALLL